MGVLGRDHRALHDDRVQPATSPVPGPSARAVLSPEVSDALRSGRPVVALESTLLAHGLPRPENRKAADLVEDAVRRGGAGPAPSRVLARRPHARLAPAPGGRGRADPERAKTGGRGPPIAAAPGPS